MTRQLPVVGIFTRDPLFEADLLLPFDLMDHDFPLGHGRADHTLLRAAPGTGPAVLTAAVQPLLVRYPDVTPTDPAAYQQQRASDLGDLSAVLGLLTALVLLAAAVATLGIANTLALAVVERTRELRLLRAVGMTARQLAAMVRWESVITAVSGALLGLGLGIALGAALARAVTIQQAGVATIALPASRLLVDLALAGTVGLVAGAVPARRAARLDPLTAIGTEWPAGQLLPYHTQPAQPTRRRVGSPSSNRRRRTSSQRLRLPRKERNAVFARGNQLKVQVRSPQGLWSPSWSSR